MFNADTLQFIGDKTVQFFADAAETVTRLIGTGFALSASGSRPVITSAEVKFQGDADAGGAAGSAVFDPRIEITGIGLLSLADASGGTSGDLKSWVVFGEFPPTELLQKLRALGTDVAPGAVVRSELTDGVAVLPDAVNAILGQLTVRPPVDVIVRDIRVVRPDKVLTDATRDLLGMSQFAQSTPVVGVYRDVQFETSDAFLMRPSGLDTFVVVQQGIEQPDGAEVETTRGNVDQLAVIRQTEQDGKILPRLIGRIPIGIVYEDGTRPSGSSPVRPNQAVKTVDNRIVYVGMERNILGEVAPEIAVVDALMMREVEVQQRYHEEGDPVVTVDGIRMANAVGSRIGDMFLDRANNYLFAFDETAPRVFIIGTNPNDERTYHRHIRTVDLPPPPDVRNAANMRITGATVTTDFQQVVLTYSDRSDQNGLVAIYNLADLTVENAQPQAVATFGQSGSGLRLTNPTGVKTRVGEDRAMKVVILDGRQSVSSAPTPGSIAVLSRDEGKWTVSSNTLFRFPAGEDSDAGEDPFTVADPVDIVFSEDGETAFVLGQRRFNVDTIERNPQLGLDLPTPRYQDNAAGTNIAIVQNLLSTSKEPRIAAATRPIPYSWGTDLGLTAKGNLVMSGGRLGNVLIYGTQEILDLLKENPDLPYFDFPVGDFEADGDRVNLADRREANTDINIRSAYGVFKAGQEDLFAKSIRTPFTQQDNGPILTGGWVRGVAEALSGIDLAPKNPPSGVITAETGSIEMPIYPASGPLQQPKFIFDLDQNTDFNEVVFTLAVAGPGRGLFVGDTSPQETAALRKLGYVDKRLDGSSLNNILGVEGNRNRIHTFVFDRAAIKTRMTQHGGRFEVELPANTVLTAGQRYYWGVEAVHPGDADHPRGVRETSSFVVEPVKKPEGAPYAGVTVVTHGLSGPLFGPEAFETTMNELGEAIAAQSGGVVLRYDPTSAKNNDPRRFGNWVAQGGDPKTATSIVLIPDWTDASTVNDAGFSEAAADAFYAAIMELDDKLENLLTSPLHFIGQDRGASVNSEIIQRLLAERGEDKLGKIQHTTIDPSGIPQPQMKLPLTDLLDLFTSMAKITAAGFFTYGVVSAYVTASSGGLAGAVTAASTGAAFRYGTAIYQFQGKVDNVSKGMKLLGIGNMDMSDFKDPIVINWDGVDFADNYYQGVADRTRLLSFTTAGAKLPTADINFKLDGLPGFFEDDSLPYFNLGKTGQRGIGVGTLNNRAVGWYLGTADLQADDYVSTGGDSANIWRQASDRFIDVNSAHPEFGSLLNIARYARFYKDDSPATPNVVVEKGSRAYQDNQQSWYIAREFEKPTGPTRAQGTAAVDTTAWEGVGTGWFYSSLGGGGQLRDGIKKTDRSKYQADTYDNASETGQKAVIEDVFNGDFETGFRPIWGRLPIPGRSAYEVAGWSFHGGGTDVVASLSVADYDGFGSATLRQSLPIPLVSGLNYGLDFNKLEKALPKYVTDPAQHSILMDGLNIIADKVYNFAAITDSFKNAKTPLDVFEGIGKYITTRAEGELADFVMADGFWGAFQSLMNGFYDELDTIRDGHYKGMKPADVLKDLRNHYGAAWNETDIKGEPSNPLRKFAQGVLFDVALKYVLQAIPFIQEHLLTRQFHLVEGEKLVHNQLYFPPNENRVGVDVGWTHSLVEGAEAANQLKVYAEVAGKLIELQPENGKIAQPLPASSLPPDLRDLGPADFYATRFLDRPTVRYMYVIPEEVQGKAARLVLRNVATAEAVFHPGALLDNISFSTALEITETSGDRDDLTFFFSDSGQSFENASGRAALLQAQADGTGIDRHELVFENKKDVPVTIEVDFKPSRFLQIDAVEGNWALRAGQATQDGTTLTLQDGSTAGRVSITLAADAKAHLALSAFVTEDYLKSVEGTEDALLLSTGMTIRHVSDGESPKIERGALFYLMDMSDAAANDGALQLRDTLEGETRLFNIRKEGTFASDAALDAALTFAGRGFITVDDTDAAIEVRMTNPTTLGRDTPRYADEAELSVIYKNREIGKVKLEGAMTTRQTIGLNLDGLKAAIQTQLTALAAEAAVEGAPAEDLEFVTLFEDLTGADWTRVETEVQTRVKAMLASVTDAHPRAFSIKTDTSGGLRIHFRDGAVGTASPPIEISETEREATELGDEIRGLAQDKQSELNGFKDDFDAFKRALEATVIGAEEDQETFRQAAEAFGASAADALGHVADAKAALDAFESGFLRVVEAATGDPSAQDRLGDQAVQAVTGLDALVSETEQTATEYLDSLVSAMAAVTPETPQEQTAFNAFKALQSQIAEATSGVLSTVRKTGLTSGSSFSLQNSMLPQADLDLVGGMFNRIGQTATGGGTSSFSVAFNDLKSSLQKGFHNTALSVLNQLRGTVAQGVKATQQSHDGFLSTFASQIGEDVAAQIRTQQAVTVNVISRIQEQMASVQSAFTPVIDALSTRTEAGVAALTAKAFTEGSQIFFDSRLDAADNALSASEAVHIAAYSGSTADQSAKAASEAQLAVERAAIAAGVEQAQIRTRGLQANSAQIVSLLASQSTDAATSGTAQISAFIESLRADHSAALSSLEQVSNAVGGLRENGTNRLGFLGGVPEAIQGTSDTLGGLAGALLGHSVVTEPNQSFIKSGAGGGLAQAIAQGIGTFPAGSGLAGKIGQSLNKLQDAINLQGTFSTLTDPKINPFALKTGKVKIDILGVKAELDMFRMTLTLPDKTQQANSFNALKSLLSETETWFTDAQAATSELSTLTSGLLSGGSAEQSQSTAARGFSGLFSPQEILKAALGDFQPSALSEQLNNLITTLQDTSGITPDALSALKGKVKGAYVDPDTAWGNAEYQAKIAREQLGQVAQSADAAGLDQAAELGALVGAGLDGIDAALASYGESLGDLGGLVADLLGRDSLTADEAAALRSEKETKLATVAGKADDAANVTEEFLETAEEAVRDTISRLTALDPAARLGYASFDFAPAKTGRVGDAAQLGRLLRDDIDLLQTIGQRLFDFDRLLNEDGQGEQIVLDTRAFFQAVKAKQGNDGFNPVAAFAETVAWAYAHEIAHTQGLPDLYDFDNEQVVGDASLMGARDTFAMTQPLQDLLALAANVVDTEDRTQIVTRITDLIAQAKQAGGLEADAVEGRDFAFAPGDPVILSSGWTVLGDVTEAAGVLTLREGSTSRSSAARGIDVPPDATTLRFEIGTALVQEAGVPPDAIELALKDEHGRALYVLPLLAGTDAALNIQADGTIRKNDKIILTALPDADGLTRYLVEIDASELPAGTRLNLYVDLIGFGAQSSRFVLGLPEFETDGSPQNTRPQAINGTAQVEEDGSVLIDLRTLVSDADQDPLTISVVDPTLNGSLETVSPGVLRYTPAPDTFGLDGFTFTASDGDKTSAPATVLITVQPTDDRPTLAAIADQTLAEGDTLRLSLQGRDIDGDALTYALVSGPDGAALDAETGALTWAAADGPFEARFTVSVTDGNSAPIQRSFDVTVSDVAPSFAIPGPDTVLRTTPITAALAFSDPGADPISSLTVDWGDGTVQTLPTDATSASHSYDVPGPYVVTAELTTEDGAVITRAALVSVTTPGLRVVSVEPAPWGARVRFNAEFFEDLPNASRLPGAPDEPIDVEILAADGTPVPGSLVLDADRKGFVFVASGGGLSPGDYTLRLLGGDTGWRNRYDRLETGDTDVFERHFSVAGAGIDVDVADVVAPAGAQLGGTTGLPVTLTQVGGIRTATIRLAWDADILTLEGLDTSLPGATITALSAPSEPDAAGWRQALFRITLAKPSVAGPLDVAQIIGRIASGVPAGTVADALAVAILDINGTTNPGIDPIDEDRSLIVATPKGDADASGTVTPEDRALIEATDIAAREGFDAWRLLDPNLIFTTFTDEGQGQEPGTDPNSSTAQGDAGRPGIFAAPEPRAIQLSGLSVERVALLEALTTQRSGSETLVTVAHSGMIHVCAVPIDGPAQTVSPRAAMCFTATPADVLALGATLQETSREEMPADTPMGVDITEDGALCLITDPDSALADGGIALVPQSGGASSDAGESSARVRLCFAPEDAMAQEGDAPTHPIAHEEASEDTAALQAVESGKMAILMATLPAFAQTTQAKKPISHSRAMLLGRQGESDGVMDE